jgi:hypothetical protein
MGRLFNPNLANITDIFYGAVDNGSSWAAISKGYTKTMPKLIQKISDAFLAQQG